MTPELFMSMKKVANLLNFGIRSRCIFKPPTARPSVLNRRRVLP